MPAVIEAMLLRWGESPGGRTVTFLLPEDDGAHPFKGLKAGRVNGQRLALSVALIADDETETPLPGKAPEKPRHSLAQQAGMLCGDARFERFLTECCGDCQTWQEDGRTLNAAETVRRACKVASRAEFDSDPEAAARWRELHGRYLAWLQT